MEQLQQEGKFGKLYGKILQIRRRKSKSSMVIKDKGGNLLTDESDVTQRWKEYIEDLYNRNNCPTDEEMEECVGPAPKEDDLWPSLLKEELTTMLKQLQNGKAEGVDDIPGKMLKCIGEKAIEELIEICQQIYTTGEWPSDFLQTVMIPLEKKTNTTECQDYRTISLISHASKIILKILTKRIEAKATVVNWITNEQD